jgi:asparagine synthase (glutamine-hydrolysing)
MTHSMRHRGPDDGGTFVDGQVGLGHRRLAIIDLSSAGHQPMFSADRRFCTVFNGEIYNFRDLRRELEKRGHTFRGHSDTEVILASYAEHGPSCVECFQGMFAFAIWDLQEKTLFVARDRLGKKPLYYVADGHRLAFASEIQALRRLRWVPDDLDRDAINAYFTLQYIPGPATAYRHIRKLLPGYALTATGFGRHVRTEPYWRLDSAVATEGGDPTRRVTELLEEAVGLRLIADVEVGILLSGGVDSSLITAMAARQSSRPLKTFSVGFRDRALDETRHAEEIASLCKTDHRTLSADEVTPQVWEDVVDHMDEPLGDAACIPTYLIAKVAAQHVKVVLSGEGADESFGGYPHYRLERIAGRTASLPAPLRRNLAKVMCNWPATRLASADRLEKVLQSRPEAGASRWVTVFGERDRRRLFSAEFLAATDATHPLESIHRLSAEYATTGSKRRTIDTDLRSWLPDDLLMKVDRMTMAHSLEARAPFVDHRLVEYVRRCDVRWTYGATGTKRLLKKIARAYLPTAIVDRPKHGFDVPHRQWLLGNFRELAEECFSPKHLAGTPVFDAGKARREWETFVVGRYRGTARRIWLMFCFLQWHAKHLQLSRAVPPFRVDAAVPAGETLHPR